MNWNQLQTTEQLDEIVSTSKDQAVIIFKHSTTCPISTTALSRFERAWQDEVGAKPFLLDLKRYREVSNNVAEKFNVEHESPQLLLIKDGKTVYHESHFGINFGELSEYLKQQ